MFSFHFWVSWYKITLGFIFSVVDWENHIHSDFLWDIRLLWETLGYNSWHLLVHKLITFFTHRLNKNTSELCCILLKEKYTPWIRKQVCCSALSRKKQQPWIRNRIEIESVRWMKNLIWKWNLGLWVSLWIFFSQNHLNCSFKEESWGLYHIRAE